MAGKNISPFKTAGRQTVFTNRHFFGTIERLGRDLKVIYMEEKIKVLGVELDCLTAKEAMINVLQFFENDALDAVELISMNMLMNGQDDPQWQEMTGRLQMLLPGEAEILEAAQVGDRTKVKDAGERTFLKMFMKYLQKSHKRVFLLAESEEEMLRVEDAVRHFNRGIRFTGHALLQPQDNLEENVINDINGTETDCILSVLPSPYQEEFIARNRPLLNAKVWLGCGSALWQSYDERKLSKRIRHFFLCRMFRRSVELQQREER